MIFLVVDAPHPSSVFGQQPQSRSDELVIHRIGHLGQHLEAITAQGTGPASDPGDMGCAVNLR